MAEFDERTIARHVDLLRNRIRKNVRRLASQFAADRIEAYRLYDWDIPEVRATVDRYADHIVVSEYAREQTQDLKNYLPRLGAAAAEVLEIPKAGVHLRKRRTRNKGGGPRYERLAKTEEEIVVHEGDLKFLVNLDDFVDTGLFLDHRITRSMFAAQAKGKRVLNLFCYTGAFSVYALHGGARRVTSVDVSQSYLDWAERNVALNKLPKEKHQRVATGIEQFLADERRDRYDLCMLDPPSYSTVGLGGRPFDILQDHPALVRRVLGKMSSGGVLYFSTNHQAFEPRLAGIGAERVEEITKRTVPRDFRNQTVHRCFRIAR